MDMRMLKEYQKRAEFVGLRKTPGINRTPNQSEEPEELWRKVFYWLVDPEGKRESWLVSDGSFRRVLWCPTIVNIGEATCTTKADVFLLDHKYVWSINFLGRLNFNKAEWTPLISVNLSMIDGLSSFSPSQVFSPSISHLQT